MKTYTISTTTHDKTGKIIDTWAGYYLKADTRKEAVTKAVTWENKLLTDDGIETDISGNTIYYDNLYIVVHADIIGE